MGPEFIDETTVVSEKLSSEVDDDSQAVHGTPLNLGKKLGLRFAMFETLFLVLSGTSRKQLCLKRKLRQKSMVNLSPDYYRLLIVSLPYPIPKQLLRKTIWLVGSM